MTAPITGLRVSPEISRPFSPREFAARLRRVQAEMTTRELSALVVTDPANMYYLTGYNAWSFYTPQCLVVPVEGGPHLFARAMDAQGAHYTADLGPHQIHGYPEELVHRPDTHPMVWVTKTAVGLGLLPTGPGSRVAAELDAHFFSPRGYLSLQEGLAGAELVDSAELINWVRLVKSPAEQHMLRTAGRIAEHAMRTAIGAIEPGRRQCDIVADIQRAQTSGLNGLGGDYPAIVPMLPTGATAGTPHLTWSDRVMHSGEAATIELAGVHQRYHAPLARTLSLGPPPKHLVDCADAVSEGRDALLEELRPGRTAHEVHAAFTREIAKHGLTKESRIGYSIGIGYPPDWGERTVSLRHGSETVLEVGMAFHVILGMWMGTWGYETSEPLLVTATGPQRLTNVPGGLTIKT
ncbi:M24 family metallopeptidase [Ornithinimicrobium ciconiae]|uniref:M24 family metallopeptidase n=1 Tax=Ornithinimicrobium ciconiae TaxID=2594265 RepID=A0A516GCT6_9MICO|nr:M24 family metallopeptidase [Ornithinimicrobium ciconiae]QDO89322.1 M24 family metallopeptidase [Ornithinimicrobium ciconiae]